MLERLTGNAQTAAAVFMTDDPSAARRLLGEKQVFRDLETQGTEAHFGFKPRAAGRLVQECGKGLVDIKIDGERLFLALPEPEFREPTKSHLAAVADSLGVSGADVQRAAIIDVGPVWFTVQLVSGDAIGLLGSRCRCNHSAAQDPGEFAGQTPTRPRSPVSGPYPRRGLDDRAHA